MADLLHPGLDLRIEIKCDHLNGKTSKSKAELAYNRVDPAKRFGKHAAYYQVQNQWNHAAPKQAIVQGSIGAPQLAIAFTKHPDEATLNRIEKLGIQAFSLTRFAGILAMQLDADTATIAGTAPIDISTTRAVDIPGPGLLVTNCSTLILFSAPAPTHYKGQGLGLFF